MLGVYVLLGLQSAHCTVWLWMLDMLLHAPVKLCCAKISDVQKGKIVMAQRLSVSYFASRLWVRHPHGDTRPLFWHGLTTIFAPLDSVFTSTGITDQSSVSA